MSPDVIFVGIAMFVIGTVLGMIVECDMSRKRTQDAWLSQVRALYATNSLAQPARRKVLQELLVEVDAQEAVRMAERLEPNLSRTFYLERAAASFCALGRLNALEAQRDH